MQSLIDRSSQNGCSYRVTQVVSNRPEAKGLQRAERAGIDTSVVRHQDFGDRETFDRAMAAVLDAKPPQLLILAGFMRILSPWFVRHYEGRILNIHPALLPAYPGLNTHQRVIDAGDSHHGSSVHFVTEELDGGPPVVQGRLPVKTGETAEHLGRRVQRIEHEIYPLAAEWYGLGRLRFRDGHAWLDNTRMSGPVIRDYPDA